MSNNKTDPNEPINTTNYRESYTSIGLTKREYFAAMAMQGLLTKPLYYINRGIGEEAVQIADNLIEALNNEQQEE